MFQIDPVCDPCSFPYLHPRSGEGEVHGIEDLPVFLIQSTCVPQPVGDQFLSLRSLTKIKASSQIFVKGHAQIVGFKGVQRNIDLMQGSRAQQHLLLFGEQCAVGGENHFKACICRHFQKSFQFRVAQWLTHHVKVQEIRPLLQPGQ